ncbi:uncharacterized protein MELLADRAFT_124555 [Melampsora larici-populina 98AG31]|uniref:Secreted protein n=1 Tax=Melampsora larici-populina (strain 98AG31 / pathotype 3-4-7) TaxID=747676 RepID=F4SAT2_MELLP|nr:uncharacterized protein MELLADRAFT_124555 [Melampsora larici-populina 98AG31]EGF98250.1 secreted protein [Melampsora larici-populina 98AG31]
MLAILKSIILVVALTHGVAATTVAEASCISTADTLNPVACARALQSVKAGEYNTQSGTSVGYGCGFCQVLITPVGNTPILSTPEEIQSAYAGIINSCRISPGSTRPGSITIPQLVLPNSPRGPAPVLSISHQEVSGICPP